MGKPNRLRKRTLILVLTLCLTGLAACNLGRSRPNRAENIQLQEPTATATETLPPYTPLATLTPSRTLKPPPTFRPPTSTVLPSLTPSATPTPAFVPSVVVPGLRGNETATPTSTIACEVRKEWKLTYTVQPNDALEQIANKYNTSVQELAKANCLSDINLIVVGQRLKVPGETHPVQPEVECRPFEVLSPINGAFNLPGGGLMSFVWHGPRARRNLVRIIRPDGSMFENVVDLRQNDEIDADKNLPNAGTYTWYVYPLDENFLQIPCLEGGPWTFTKLQAPTPTPTPTP